MTDDVTGAELVKLHLRKAISALEEMSVQCENQAGGDEEEDDDPAEDDQNSINEAISGVEDAINALDSITLTYDITDSDLVIRS